MKPYQLIGYVLNQTTAITSIVGSGSSARIYHGLRPQATATPCINYFELGPGRREFGFENKVYTINCRSTTPGEASDLASLVVTAFAGAEGLGTYGLWNGFDVTRAALRQNQGLIPETEEGVYNAPVDIQIVYPTTTVT